MISNKNRLHSLIASFVAAIVLLQTPFTYAGNGPLPTWIYDAGPNPTDPMGKELIDLNSAIPYYPGISTMIAGDQKFRPAFGPMPWRMMQPKNSVKILFIGQDGTHIAEAAGRPATAGFGGRAQDLAKYFGVTSSAAFINAYAFTIRGQAMSFGTPVIENKNGDMKISYGSFTDNHLWMISNDLESPIPQWRNDLIEWIIRNNPDSLKMIVLFGGAAQNTAAAFITANGGQVGTKYTEEQLKNIRVPEFEMVSNGGNKEAPVPQTPEGKDLYLEAYQSDAAARAVFEQEFRKEYRDTFREEYPVGKPVVFTEATYKGVRYLGTDPAIKQKSRNTIMETMPVIQAMFKKAFDSDPTSWQKRMVFAKGINGSGIIHPAQLGGYDTDNKMVINGEKTISLKGLKVGGQIINHDILMVQFPHPTSLSMMNPQQASEAIAKDLAAFPKYVQRGWKIEPDHGQVNQFAAGKKYQYGRTSIGPEYYDFGAPASRMVDVSDAVRLNANVIIVGTRESSAFNENDPAILNSLNGRYTTKPSDSEMWTTRPRSEATRYTFDAGPGEEFAQLMIENLPGDEFYGPLEKKVEQLERLEKQNKLPPAQKPELRQGQRLTANMDYGHYRGTFQNPRVVIFADPAGYDDIITARALSGARGQYLHGLMSDLGVGNNYLVIKTAPYDMDEKNMADWELMFGKTTGYRDALFPAVVKHKPELVLVDGVYAEKEAKRLNIPHVVITRKVGVADSGIKELAGKLPGAFAKARITGKILDLPRAQLSYYARMWEGTSGDRVIPSNHPDYRGIAFAEVAPKWATTQKFQMDAAEVQKVNACNARIRDLGLRMGGESVSSFAKRAH
ncbi:MAG: hypothetical protein AB7P04_13485 [Bacteriovoracia bacterium]